MKRHKKHTRGKRVLLILTGILLVSVLVIFFALQLKSGEKSVLGSRALTPTPSPIRLPHGSVIEVAYRPHPLLILAVEIKKESTLMLLPNFKEKAFGEAMAGENGCDVAINGGFYKGNATPLGLFITNGEKFGGIAKSSVANGFFRQEQGGLRIIAGQPPETPDTLDFVLQSGPYITVGKRKLSLREDSRARRSLLGIDNQNRLFFISVKGKGNNFSGPLLADIPVIFGREEIQEILPLTTILNLDGGGASFFYSRDAESTFYLSEISPIGSLLCAKLKK